MEIKPEILDELIKGFIVLLIKHPKGVLIKEKREGFFVLVVQFLRGLGLCES